MKSLLLLISTVYLFTISSVTHALSPDANKAVDQLSSLEKTFDGKIGVYAIDTSNHHVIAYRSLERFPVQSTMKLMSVAALLKQSTAKKNLLQEKINYTKNDLAIVWHPVTGQHLANGMTLEELSEAAISYSDNTAINLIIKKLGGPEAITQFATSIDNKTFNIVHYDGDLNSDPNNEQDTSTPKDMAISIQKLMLGNILTTSEQNKLMTWMRNNTAGYKRIRSGTPIGWVVADKTGSGDYGIANDIGMLWSPTCKPIIIAIYTVQNKKDAKRRDDIVASTTQIIFDEFSKNDICFKKLFA
jgi:beta-lactamase class A